MLGFARANTWSFVGKAEAERLGFTAMRYRTRVPTSRKLIYHLYRPRHFKEIGSDSREICPGCKNPPPPGVGHAPRSYA